MKSKEIVITFMATFALIGLFIWISSASPSSSLNSGKEEENFKSLIGKTAPDFSLESYDGRKVALSSLKGKNVLLFFNEGLLCYPACWNQIAAFGSDERFNNETTVAFSIVNDKKEDWKGAVDKMPELAKAAVLLDSERVASNAYGVLSLPSSMHKGNLAGHTYVLIDKDGVVRFTLDDPRMATRNDEMAKEIEKL